LAKLMQEFSQNALLEMVTPFFHFLQNWTNTCKEQKKQKGTYYHQKKKFS
jgi:hypothetical protein